MLDRPTGRFTWAVIGVSLGALVGAWLAFALVMLYEPLHIRIAMSHALFLLILIAVPPVAGASVGWLFAASLTRSNIGRGILVRWRRWLRGSWPVDWTRFR